MLDLSFFNSILIQVPPEHMGLVEFFGTMTIGITAGMVGLI